MSYIMLEGLVCVVVAVGITTLVFASSLVVMLAYQELQTPFEEKPGLAARPDTSAGASSQ
jgi:hypothetical protein